MEDNTIVTLASMSIVGVLLLASLLLGNMNDAIIAVSAGAIGVGAGVSIPIGAVKKE